MNQIRFYITSFCLLSSVVASSQNFALKSSTLNSGSETATSTSFQLNGAIGEISSGPSTSTNFILNAGSISSRTTATITPGLIAHYPFDLNLDDVSGNMYTAAYSGTQTYDLDVAGLSEKAFYFDGATRVTNAFPFTTPINFTGFTVSVWVNLDDPTSTSAQHIIGLESTDRIFQIVANNGDFAFFEGDTGGSGLGIVNIGATSFGWTHLAVTWDGTTVTGYLDGTPLNSGTAPVALNFDVETFSLGENGHFPDSDQFLSGIVDEAKIFNYALTEEEIRDLYNSYPPDPTTPQNVVVKVIGPGSIQLTWDDGPDETYYEVYWEDPDLISGNIELAQDETTYTITGLSTDIEYYIEVTAGNDAGGINFNSVFATPVNLVTPVAQSLTPYFTLDETITIQYYPQLSYPVDDLIGASKVYMYAGLIAPEDVETGEWTNPVGNFGVDDGIGEMVLNGGVWEITITPRSYFGVTDNFVAAQMAMVFTNEDGTLLGKAADLADVKIDIFDQSNIAPLGGFLATDVDTDVYLGDADAFIPSNIQLENRSEFTMEALVNFDDVNPSTATFMELVTRGIDDGTSYTPLHGIVHYTSTDLLSFPTGLITTEISGTASNNTLDFGDDTYANNTWRHVALVYTTPSSSNLDVYINGVFSGSLGVVDFVSASNMLRIGNFTGGVDELRFWDDARTEEEIRRNIKTEIDAATPGLIGYWKMNGTTTDGTITNEATSGNDLIVGNATITQLSDLDVISLAVNPKSIAQNETLSISYTVENIGAADAETFDLDFYLSADATYDGADQFLENVNFASGLVIDETVFNIIQTTIPSATADGDYFVIAVIDGQGVVNEENETNNTDATTLNINVNNVNNPPTDFNLDATAFDENLTIGTLVANISDNDPDDDLITYSLVAGTGDTDNNLFQINGSELLTNSTFDFETDKSSYSIRIEVNDNRGGTFQSEIGLTLSNVNEAPTAINLSNEFIEESSFYIDEIVGSLSTVDPDAGDSFNYQITVNDGTATFSTAGSNLLITVSAPMTDDTYNVTISSTDQGGLSTSQEFTITVGRAGEAPSGLMLSNSTINENQGPGATVGSFMTIDGDSDTHTYSFTSGGTDNASFELSSAGVLTLKDDLPEGNYSISVTTTDDTDLTFTRTFTIRLISNAVNNSLLSVGSSVNNYRLIGVPFTSTTIGDVFPDLTNEGQGSEWRILGFNNGNTSDLSTIQASLTGGNGYWIISTKSLSIQLPDDNLITGPATTKPLSSGWNAIGNPYLAPLDWSVVLSDNVAQSTISSGTVGAINVWNGGWNTTTQLDVMQGGYVKSDNQASGFRITAPTSSTGSARLANNERISSNYFENTEEWQLMFMLESKSMSSNISGVGINPAAVNGIDQMDNDAPPTPGVFDPLQLTEKASGLTKNLKAINKSITWEFAFTGSDESTTISWNQTVADQVNEKLMIAFLPQGEIFDMSSMGSVTFEPEKNQSVMVIYGEELPKELLYHAITAYPNPVDQEVSFRFYVDGEGSIPASVELFNLGGQRLGAINQNVNGGNWAEIKYQVGAEDLLKSGIYLFKIKYSGFESAVKKLIVR